MWYVLRSIAGNENEVCQWINACMDKNCYSRCFTPLYEDVRKREGKGCITVRRMFDGYIFLESDRPMEVLLALKKTKKCRALLHENGEGEKVLFPIAKEEEEFLRSILTGGLLTVTYIRKTGRVIEELIGPLEKYKDCIEIIDMRQRKAYIRMRFGGEEKTVRFGLWTDLDPKLERIEAEKARRKAEKRAALEKRREKIGMFHPGDFVIHIEGLFGDAPLEVARIDEEKETLGVKLELFGEEKILDLPVEAFVKAR
ncbi:MAG: hypothetical protein IJ600_11080 [Lachnospiraceae bacterium]|nr:hypothetical protein [Lachnospiraceae bacterium]